MDNPLRSVHLKKATKKAKPKKKPVKVVYISNPMKVKTSASEFRALVQELTGQDAELPDPSKYPDTDDVGWHQTVPDAMKNVDDLALKVPRVDHAHELPEPENSDVPFEPFDDDFMPQMIENYSGFLQSSLLYESLQVDVLRSSLDAV